MAKRRTKKYNATGRSDTRRFVLLDFALLETGAYRSLGVGARALLIEFHMLYNGANNGTLFMSQRDAAERLGVRSHATAARYIAELEDRGFIKTRIKGSFSNKTKLASTFLLTNQRYNDEPATREFRKWTPPTRQKSRKQKLDVTGSKKRPALPEGWPDGSHNPPCSDDLAGPDGADYQSTYNIPQGEGVEHESEAPQTVSA